MEEFIFGERNNIHIINLEKTVPMLYTALEIAHEIAKRWKNIICWNQKICTEIIATSALNCGQFYVKP